MIEPSLDPPDYWDDDSDDEQEEPYIDAQEPEYVSNKEADSMADAYTADHLDRQEKSRL